MSELEAYALVGAIFDGAPNAGELYANASAHYRSVMQMGEDIERHIDGECIAATLAVLIERHYGAKTVCP